MNSPQQSLASTHSPAFEPGDAGRWLLDDDIPLGCECANPALQIERWSQETPASLPDTY
jgi:hypothetical protein